MAMPEPANFDALYAHDPDPFGVRSSWYERRKLDVLLASLALPQYAAAWDPACGTGDLVAALSDRCGHVLATDGSPRAVGITSALVDGRDGVEVREHRLPERLSFDVPAFDLLVVAEVLYYLPADERARTCELLHAVAARGQAEIIAVHWRHHPHDAHLSGEQVTGELGRELLRRGWSASVRHDDPDFVLASWRRQVDPEAGSA